MFKLNRALKIRGKKYLLLAVAGIAVLAASSLSVSAAPLKFGSFIPPKASEVREGIIPWIKEVEKATDGELSFQQFFGGALSRSPLKQYELLQNGVQDVTIIVTPYVASVFPDFSLFALPYLGLRNAEEASVALWRMGQTGLMRGLDRVHVVTLYTNDNSHIHTRDKTTSIEDLKGMKIRAAGPTEATITKILGATGVGMPITQVAQSLNTGVIKGAMSTWGAIRAFRLERLVNATIEDQLGVRTFIIAINKKVYAGLSDKAKKVLSDTGGEKLARHMGQVFDRQSARVRAKAVADRPDSIISFSATEQKHRAKLFQPVHDQWMEKNDQGKELLAKFNVILADIRAGK